jgi:DNA-binding beta-propeller fold protein YncE
MDFFVFFGIKSMTRINAIIIFLFICQTSFSQTGGNTDTLVWPSPPERARLKHLTTLSSSDNFRENKGVISKIFKFLFGGENPTPWLVQPVGVAVSREGIIYVADPGANGVHRIDQKERKHTFVQESKDGYFRSPVAVACSDDGNVYISDSERGMVVITNGDLETRGVIKGNIERPTGISIIHGKLYIVDTGRHKILIYDLKGNYLAEFGQRGINKGEFNFPVQIAGKDTICVVDALNYRIQIFSADGKYERMFGQQGNAIGRFASPKGVALDSDGDIYVTDALLDNLQIFNSGGSLLLSVGQKGSRNGEFLAPSGIAVDAQDRVYIVETLNKRIQIFQYTK